VTSGTFIKPTFGVRRSRGEMYIGHGRLCVCLSIAILHYCTDPDVSWRNGRGCPLVVHYGRLCNRCTDFVAMTTSPNSNCQRVLVLALCLVAVIVRCHYAWQRNMYLLKIAFSQISPANLMDLDTILQAYIGRTQISRLKD